MQFWTREEFNKFIPILSNKPHSKLAFEIMYWTGMRIGELLALTPSDIDIKNKTISINKSYQRLGTKDVIIDLKLKKVNLIY